MKIGMIQPAGSHDAEIIASGVTYMNYKIANQANSDDAKNRAAD